MATDLPWLSDRDAELWLPLYAVCSVAMSSRLTELQHASKLLCDTKAETDEDESVALKLLKDLMEVWPNDQSRLETKVLISQLKQVDASPWSEEDFHLSGRKLARILRPFGVTPIKYEHGKRGYERAALGPAWNRYLATHAPHPPPH